MTFALWIHFWICVCFHVVYVMRLDFFSHSMETFWISIKCFYSIFSHKINSIFEVSINKLWVKCVIKITIVNHLQKEVIKIFCNKSLNSILRYLLQWINSYTFWNVFSNRVNKIAIKLFPLRRKFHSQQLHIAGMSISLNCMSNVFLLFHAKSQLKRLDKNFMLKFRRVRITRIPSHSLSLLTLEYHELFRFKAQKTHKTSPLWYGYFQRFFASKRLIYYSRKKSLISILSCLPCVHSSKLRDKLKFL